MRIVQTTAADIFFTFMITSVRTEELPEDITKILESVIEQIEAARRNKENQDNPIDVITQNDSRIFYMKSKSDPNDSKKIAETLYVSVDENEGKSHMFPSYLQQNLDISNITYSDSEQTFGSMQDESKSLIFQSSLEDDLNILESTNTENLSSIESTLKSDDFTINPQAREHKSVDEIVSQLSGRRANLDIDDTKAKQPEIIIDQYTNVDRFDGEIKSNNQEIARMPINTTDFSSAPNEYNLRQIHKTFQKPFKKIRDIKKIHKMEGKQKLNIIEPQYRSTLQRDLNRANKPSSGTSQVVLPIAEPFIIIKRIPWLPQPYYPQNIHLFLKPPVNVVQNPIKQSYPRHGHQVRLALVPRIQKVILRQYPVFLDKVPKILRSSMPLYIRNNVLMGKNKQ